MGDVVSLAGRVPENLLFDPSLNDELGGLLQLTENEQQWWLEKSARVYARHGAFTDDHRQALVRTIFLSRAHFALKMAGEDATALEISSRKRVELEQLIGPTPQLRQRVARYE